MNSAPVSLNSKDLYSQITCATADEICSPLANISLAAAMLKEELNEEVVLVYLDIIMRNSVRVNKSVNTLLSPTIPDEPAAEKDIIQQLLDEAFKSAKDKMLWD